MSLCKERSTTRLDFVRPKVGQLGRKSIDLLTRSCFMRVYEGEYVREYTCSGFIRDNISTVKFVDV